VLEAFLDSEMGVGCRLLEPRGIGDLGQGLRTEDFAGALLSPHELRVESREAIPRLAAYLAERHAVTFMRDTVVHAAAPPRLETSRGPVEAETVIVCPGDDLGMVRYLGYAEQPAAAALRVRLEAEQGEHLANGVHLIVVRSADGSLVVGDSHHYGTTPDPFAPTGVDDLILDEYAAVFSGPRPALAEHWTGTYASAPDRLMLVDRPANALRIVLITSGTGASTSFAIGEEVIAELYG
jgi:glycine/D-amino acid oxidase-like deaminating enzyme